MSVKQEPAAGHGHGHAAAAAAAAGSSHAAAAAASGDRKRGKAPTDARDRIIFPQSDDSRDKRVAAERVNGRASVSAVAAGSRGVRSSAVVNQRSHAFASRLSFAAAALLLPRARLPLVTAA